MQQDIDMDSLEWESDDGPDGEETDEDDWISSEEMKEDDWSIAGEVRRIEEGVGDYNSRLYELAVDLGETRLFFGKTSIDRTVDRLEVKEGDVIAIRNKGETWSFENDDEEEVEVEQRERVDPTTGETETYAQRVARASWEGFITPFELMETVYAFKKAKEELVPLAQEALEAKAGADIDVLKNTDRFAGGLLVGAEEDTFFDDPGDAFDWDMSGGVDLDEMNERDRALDDDPDRDDLPEPGSKEMQNGDALEVEADD